MNKKSKFYVKDNTPLKKKVSNFLQSLLFWKGRKKGIIHTRDVTWDDIRAVFFPKTFHEKYQYLGCVPWREDGDIFKAMEPLVIFMDHKAKPKWCPRWVLRFLHLFGNDNSIVRVRNWTLHKLSRKLTKGYTITDYKTKWYDYDLRIYLTGTVQMMDLSDAIEWKFFNKGRRESLAEQIRELDPLTKFHSGYDTDSLKEELDRLEEFATKNEK